jgi:anti-anti-sigma factor
VNTLNIEISRKTNAANHIEITMALDGNLDNSTVGTFEPKLKDTLASKPVQLVFDLARLKFLTSAGIRLFFMAVKQLKQQGGHVSFINLQPQIKEVFAIIGEIPDIRIFKDQAELDAYLLARQRTYQP